MEWIKSGKVKTYTEMKNDIEKGQNSNLSLSFFTFFGFKHSECTISNHISIFNSFNTLYIQNLYYFCIKQLP